MNMIKLGENGIGKDSEVKLIKFTRGLAIFTEQTFFAKKVLSHEQAIELRDYLINNYPLEK